MAFPSNSEEYQTMRKALILLHSSHPNSATELRMMLDEAINQHYGPEKMLCNRLTKEQLEREANFPGRAATPPPPTTPVPADEVINLTHSPAKTISDSPDTIVDSDEGGGDVVVESMLTAGEEDGNLKEFGDLNCCVCGQMMFTATNRLVECSACGTLYHQECHKPPISDAEASDDQGHNWMCDSCFNKPSTSKAAGIVVIADEPMPLVTSKTKSSATSSRSSSSSNSSSSFFKQDQAVSVSSSATTIPAATVSTASSKHHKKGSTSSSSSKSHKSERSKGASTSKSSSSKSSRQHHDGSSSGTKRKLK